LQDFWTFNFFLPLIFLIFCINRGYLCANSFAGMSLLPNNSKNLKKRKKSIPTELLEEIVKFLPFLLKWGKIQVSFNFNVLLLKNQRLWIDYAKKIIFPVCWDLNYIYS